MKKFEEIKEIVDKLSNRKQETLIQGLRECQLKDIEHPFITKEEYIDKLLNYIKDLQQKVEQLEKENKELRDENMRIFQNVNDDELLISNAMNYAELKKAEDEIERLNNIINRIDSFVDRTIEVIKQQSTGDDEWIIERLNGIKYLIELKDSDKE